MWSLGPSSNLIVRYVTCVEMCARKTIFWRNGSQHFCSDRDMMSTDHQGVSMEMEALPEESGRRLTQYGPGRNDAGMEESRLAKDGGGVDAVPCGQWAKRSYGTIYRSVYQ